jgi:type II restriction/modification system DNA methylase subunit YeeA
MTPERFIKKWAAAALTEKSAAQQHFLDLCSLLGELPPAEADPDGTTFTFEKGGTTAAGGQGWADVWKKGAFAWEYKGPGKDLNSAYLQLKNYADMLENPPLLITSDMKRIEIHTNFTNTVKTVWILELTDLADPAKRELLRAAFANPEKLRPGTTRQQVTKEAAERFSQLAHHLQSKGYDPHRVAHFLNRLIFCMFAEDVGLLPNRIFTKLATASVAHPEAFESNAQQLFAGMSTGGAVAFEVIDWFNGGLFEDDATLPLDAAELKLVLQCAELDWSNIEPSIFGTLFERGLDPDKRSQQGTHYTDPETIMKIVNPVVLEPWQREWEAEKTALTKLVDRAKKKVSDAAKQRYYTFLERLAHYTVLDPACGSGNFLYLALRGLKDFEKRVIHEAEVLGLPLQFPRVGPEAVLGIEVNPYAAELARVTIWIGELQWMIENGFGVSKKPILKSLNRIETRDALLNDDGSQAVWPKAHAIVGNPPFLGDRKLTTELGPTYVSALRRAFADSVSGSVDLVCYWFDKARRQLLEKCCEVVGLVATNSIRGGNNRQVLTAITEAEGIAEAWADEPWVLDGAAVRVSIVCFGMSSGSRRLDGKDVTRINADLTASDADLTEAAALPQNRRVAF